MEARGLKNIVMKRSLLVSLFISLLAGQTESLYAQQDAQFSQYLFNGIYINPAYTGYKGVPNVHAMYRNQWTGLSGAPRTMSIAGDMPLSNERVGVGMLMISDKVGAESQLAVFGHYAYRIPLGRKEHLPSPGGAQSERMLAIGIGIGLKQYGLDGTKLDPVDPDPVLSARNKRVLSPDARVGVFYNTDKWYVGLSADNLMVHWLKSTQDPEGYIPEKKINLYLTGGGLVPLSNEEDGLLLKPSFLLKEDMAGPGSLDLTASVLIKQMVWVGASYRTGLNIIKKQHLDPRLRKPSAIIVLADVLLADRWRIGYAYDFSLQGTSGFNYSTHELSLGYTFPSWPWKKNDSKSGRYF